jgi:lysophospholipase L1-like esterase
VRKLLPNLALALGSVLVVLLLGELYVRVFVGPLPPRNLTLVPKQLRAPAPFRGVPYLLAPNARVVQRFGSNPRGYFDGNGKLTYETNSLGWRSPETTLEKAPGRFRILGIGDSFTFGTGVRREDLFLTRLADHLERDAPGRFEVLNLGVMGFNTSHELALLRNVGFAFHPDLVVICYVLNDAEVVSPKRAKDGDFDSVLPKRSSFSLLYDHLRERLRNRRARAAGVARILDDYRDGAPGWVSVQRSLMEIGRLSRERDVPVVLMIFPNMWELNDRYPFAPAHAKVAAAARAAGIPVLDLIDAFRGEDGVSLWVHPGNQHPNERAHAIAGKALYEYLERSGLLPAA